MAIKKARSVRKAAKPRTAVSSRSVEAPAAPAPAPVTASTPVSSRHWTLWLLAAGILLYNFGPSCRSNAAPAGAAAVSVPASTLSEPTAAWGAKLDYKNIDKFSVQEGLMDIAADANGNVYTLSGTEIRLYVGGKMKVSAPLPWAPNRSMAFDGKQLFVTNSDNDKVTVLEANLAFKGAFAVKDAQRLLGIACLPDGRLLVSSVDRSHFFFVDKAGHRQARYKGPANGPGGGFSYDLQTLPNGDVLGNDIYAGLVFTLSTGKKAIKTWPTPCRDYRDHRLPVLADKVYIACQTENVVRVLNTSGRAVGYFKFDLPEIMAAGDDGMLYVASQGTLHKIKPL